MKISTFLLFSLFLSIQAHAQFTMAYPDRHSTSSQDAWISCTPTANPNSTRGLSHWIRYDLGETYALQQSKFWNYNSPTNANSGIKDFFIDYSIDGVTWYEWGRFYMPNTVNSGFYEGENGPNFAGLIARHILITATSNHGGTCYGLSEMRIHGAPASVSNTDNIFANIDVKISPNPFNAMIQVNTGKMPEGIIHYQVTDVTGKLYLSDIMSSNILTIDGSNLPAGAYTLSLIHANGVKSLPIVKIN